MLDVHGIKAGYGAIQVLKGVDLKVAKGEIVTLIGANGAGKTTLLRAISGIIAPKSGRILFEDRNIAHLPSHKVVRRGLCLVPEGREILGNMTVLENLLMGAFVRAGKDSASDMEGVFEIFPLLRKRHNQLGRTLSGGEQQMLAIGRALMARPKLYMMDEPSLGLAPMLVSEVLRKVERLKSNDVGILLVEQNARKALKIADRGYVLEVGSVVLEGSVKALIADERIHEAYLGVKGATTA